MRASKQRNDRELNGFVFATHDPRDFALHRGRDLCRIVCRLMFYKMYQYLLRNPELFLRPVRVP